MNLSKRVLILIAAVAGSALAMPAASADVPGCTETFVGAATSPQSDSPVLQADIKHLEDGVHVYPFNAPDRVVDYVNHEWAALTAYAECI